MGRDTGGVDDVRPWGSYDRGDLPPGLRYPVGRDAVESELHAAGLRVDALVFSRPPLPLDHDGVFLVTARLRGDAHSRIFLGPDGPRGVQSELGVSAIPPAVAHEIGKGPLLAEVRAAIDWIVESLGRGNAWLASDHGWTSRIEGGRILRTRS